MSKLKAISTVFHGTTSNYIEPLLQGINTKRGSKWADFGQGFYTTSSYIQASTWAKKRCNSFNAYSSTGLVNGIVMIYKLDVERLIALNGLVFNHEGLDWARFIHKNRSKTMNFNHESDFIYGSVADGKIDELIKGLDSGIMNITSFKNSIDPRRYGFNDQLSFHTELSTQCLSFVEGVKYDDEKVISDQRR